MSWLYGPQTLTWRVNREGVLLLGGGRALLMQLAHPLVAAGVAEYSDFPRDAWGRLRRTLDMMLGMIFGTEDEARSLARDLRAIHGRVHGVLQEPTRAFPASTPYDALDPELGLWVWATLLDSSLVAYEAFVGPLTRDERAIYYDEARRLTELLDLPAARVPLDLDAFESYLRGMIEGDQLEVTPSARRLADAVLHPPLPAASRGIGDLSSVITIALLPEALRQRYGFAWKRRHRLGWRTARSLVRGSRALLPDAARTIPQARRAERRARG